LKREKKFGPARLIKFLNTHREKKGGGRICVGVSARTKTRQKKELDNGVALSVGRREKKKNVTQKCLIIARKREKEKENELSNLQRKTRGGAYGEGERG